MKALKLINLLGKPKTVCQPMAFPLTNADLAEIEALKFAFKDAFAQHRVYTLGLAAPQIGVNKRFFVMPTNFNYGSSTNFSAMKFLVRDFKVYINPTIIKYSQQQIYHNQYCLSVDANEYRVKRPTSIEVQYYKEDGTSITQKLDQLRSRVFQHQYDHLDGILMVQKGTVVPQFQEVRRRALRKRRVLS